MRGILIEHERELRELEPANRIDALTKRARRLRSQEDAALSAILDPDFRESVGVLKSRYREAQGERLRLESEIAGLNRKRQYSAEAGEWIEDTVDLLRGYIPTLVEPERRQEFVRGVLTRAEWDGRNLRLDCFIGRESGTASSCGDRFPFLQFSLKTELTAA